MRKVFSLLLVIAMFVTLFAGCNGKTNDTATPNLDPTPTNTIIASPTNEPTQTPIETPAVLPEKKFVFADYIKNKDLWDVPYIYENRFLFEIANGGQCVLDDGLGEPNTLFGICGKERWAHAEEWGNFIVTCEGKTWRNNQIIETHFADDESPKTREEAIKKINDFLDKNYKAISSTGKYYSINSFCLWQHYAAENGFDVVGAEFAEAYNFQIPLAMTRGAGKQYQIPWYIDFSMWYGLVPDYAGEYFAKINYVDYDGVEKPYGVPDGGHSMNMFERSMLMSYMAGARAVVAQDGGQLAYYNYDSKDTVQQNGIDGYFWNWNGSNVSPYGETCKKFYEFTKKLSDVGTAYTPYAIILDKYHGLTLYDGDDEPFGRFYSEKGDEFTNDLIRQIWQVESKPQKTSQRNLVNNRYGESFDMLLQNASDEIISTYKVLFLTGELVLSDEEVNKYTKYVENGGCLVVNTAYVNQFKDVELPEKMKLGEFYEEVSYGKGSFIVFGKGGMLESCIDSEGNQTMMSGKDYGIAGFYHVMELLESRYNMFEISDVVDYIVNIKEDAVYLTLINNDGVIKTKSDPPMFDETKTLNLNIKFMENYAVESVSDIYNSAPVEFNDGTASLSLKAGGIAVLEFKLK